MRRIFHVDMNSFFASCEIAKRPELEGKMVAVAGDPAKRHGIILAASYEAKKAGVKVTMPIWKAVNVCPNLIILPCKMDLYVSYSRKFMSILREYAPVVEQASIDEAYLDLTGTEEIYTNLNELAVEIQRRIYNEVGLKCSIGISENKLLAKMGSDFKKPMGVTTIYVKDVPNKIWNLKISDLIGIGRKTEEILKSIGIYKIGDLARYDRNTLRHYFGEKSTDYLINASNGLDDSLVVPNERIEAKSVGAEHTFSEDVTDIEIIKSEMLKFADRISHNLRKYHKKAKTLCVKIKYSNFTIISKSLTMQEYTNISNEIYDNAMILFNKTICDRQSIRLVGLSATNFIDEEKAFKQLTLFETDEEKIKDEKLEKIKKLDTVIDSLKGKYGRDIIKRAKNINNNVD